MKVTMSKPTQEVAEFFAHHQCLLDGLEVGTKKYDKAFEKNMHRFCEEALLHSMTPSGEIRANPLPKSVKEEVSLNLVLDKYFAGNNQQKKILKNQLSSALNSLVSAFLQVRLDKSKKERGGKGSDFAFKGHAPKGELSIEQKLEIEKNRYLSYLVSGLMFGWMERFFNQDISHFDDLMRQALDYEGKSDRELLKMLSNPKYRAKFIKQFYELARNA
jgi:hypothetical protein